MTRIILPLAAFLTGVLAVSCDDEYEPVVKQGTVQFQSDDLSFGESSEKATIAISFSKPATDHGEVRVRLSSSNIQQFQFTPSPVNGFISLPFHKGQSQVTFEVASIDNDVSDGDKTLDFTIASVTTGFDVGIKNTLATVWADDEAPSRVNFGASGSNAFEDSGASQVIISFAQKARAEGVLRISLESGDAIYGTHFTTEPAAVNGVITLPVLVQQSYAFINVTPVDDKLYNNPRTISYTIVEAEGGVTKGQNLKYDLKIMDDELNGMGKGYEIFAGNWRYKKSYEYNENGMISKVIWDQHTPGQTQGTYDYVYNSGGQLEKVIAGPGRETNYLWEGNRIVKSEEYTNNVLTQYTVYGYDQAGNVGETSVYYRQPDGSLVLSTLLVYLYHLDNNLYKILVHSIPKGSNEPVLVSTKTFDNYLDVGNPFSMVEILPNQKTQTKLPATYRVEENGHNILYNFTYKFSEAGKPLSRTASWSGGSETAYYEYY